MITDDMLIPETAIDIEVYGNDINLNIAKEVSLLEPFGPAIECQFSVIKEQ